MKPSSFLTILSLAALVACTQQPISQQPTDTLTPWTTALRSEGLLVVRDGQEDVPHTALEDETFTYLLGDYAVYAVSGYFGNSVLDGIDPGSFEIVGNGYLKDADTVLFTGMVKSQRPILHVSVEGADPLTFELVEGQTYMAQDARQKYVFAAQFIEGVDNIDYYHEGIYIPGSDPQTFQSLGWGFAKDNRNVYCGDDVLKGADTETFEPFETPSFWKDKTHVFAGCDILPGLDPATTVYLLPDIYLKDASGIYDVPQKKHVKEEDIPCGTLFPDGREIFTNCSR